ncbi:MAG: NUDIX domain-containing protein [Candidatus Faecivivens sp.]|nr:NUDIX domain-containing protein [Oscillospiraceae bacterium]MDY2712381.1 NUDIX domain-containing protein [Candidatus Faecivivens sp.]
MQYEKSCGAVVFRKYHGNTELLLIKHTTGGHWSFPKGHVEAGETEQQTARREVFEETSVQIDFCPGFREVVSYSPRRDVMKDVIYFLAHARNYDFVPQEGEIARIRWVEISLAHSFLSYDNDKQLVNRARPLIREFF